MREFICKWGFFGHRWDMFARSKRRCVRCGVEEWMLTDRYPMVGEPAEAWHDMTIRPLPLRFRFRAWLSGLNM